MIRVMRLIRGIPVHRINLIAPINHAKRRGFPSDLPVRETRDKRDAREVKVTLGHLTRRSSTGAASRTSFARTA